MKNLVSVIVAGIFGGLITLGGTYLISTNTSTPVEELQTPRFVGVNNLNVSKGTASVSFDFTEAAEKVTPVVVHIAASESKDLSNQRLQQSNDPFRGFFGNDPYNQPKKGTGSGVIISEDGYIVTNNHVVEFADEFVVTFSNNKRYQAKVIGTDPRTDLAVLKIEAHSLPTLTYADSDNAKIGQWVLAVGNPLELASTVTAGIISAKGRDINIIQGGEAIESFIQTDAAVNPGNSGGALVDAQGRLLGINTAIATQTGYFSGYSFAIPVNIMKKIVEDIIEYGSYQRGYLGISITDLDNELADELNLDITQGVVIQNVENDSPAQYAGLLPNDVIVNVNGKTINSYPELQEIVGRAKVGDQVNLKINRRGDLKNVEVRLKAKK